MTLEELKKLISKDETKNIEPQNEHQNEPQNAPQSALQKRLEAVAAMILANGSIAISVIAQNLNVSRDSIKRDLKKLGYAWEGASKNGHWVKKTPTSTSW